MGDECGGDAPGLLRIGEEDGMWVSPLVFCLLTWVCVRVSAECFRLYCERTARKQAKENEQERERIARMRPSEQPDEKKVAEKTKELRRKEEENNEAMQKKNRAEQEKKEL